ncbi:basic amino acid ABC transporter substrate-binding protein [Metasolibacillus meyeri]|uniref:Basic amino acid ABC transporter substrate-binding protein n=1 Tax=Metasolibacillus meyeri TaxID=1071052 RepID=A0AAW9NY67_9BACL|nr:basic amino acid ABC transporter substrate-binding protein [Metasolibacillus meyeri]MEC1179603.1 basic amino acid ABC transporter substrate-binding protein [Metasolibacillus meyeri]
MKKIALLFLAVLVAGVLAACGEGKSEEGSGGTGSSDKLVIQVGTSPTYPPFESDVNGELVGFDIGLIKKIAEAEGFEVEFSTMQFDGLVPALIAGQIDVVVGAITITDKRLENVAFSNAYYKSGLSILAKPSSGITGFDDLQGKLVGIQKGTSSYNYLIANGVEDRNIKQYADISTTYSSLDTGGIDAVLYDNPSNINYITTQTTDAEIVGDILAGEYYGIAVNKKKPELVEKINAGLAKLQENGEYEKLFDEYLNGEKNGLIEGVAKPEDVVIKVQ